MKLKPENNSGLKRIQTYDLCDTSVVLYPAIKSTGSWLHCEFVINDLSFMYIHLHSSPGMGLFLSAPS